VLTNEHVQPGDKSTDRLRTDPRVKRFMWCKRPHAEALEQIVNYRTETCLALNQEGERMPQDVYALILGEYRWAVDRLEVLDPYTMRSLLWDMPYRECCALGGHRVPSVPPEGPPREDARQMEMAL
jgi:hypothetical protein